MKVTLSGMVISVRDLHPENALGQMEEIERGIEYIFAVIAAG